MDDPDDVLRFWFSSIAPDDPTAMPRQLEWWFRGGVLDQFSRTIHRGDARMYALDPKAIALTRVGLDAGHYAALDSPWEKTFFFLPLGHSEDLRDLEQAVRLAEELARAAPVAQRPMLDHSASQARAHRDVIARFGRHPHRNSVLGRVSTPDEIEYLARGDLVHQRPLPPRGAGHAR